MASDNRRFNSLGTYKCVECGKQTRETGNGESALKMCKRCDIVTSYENYHSDNCENGKSFEDCPECQSMVEASLKL